MKNETRLGLAVASILAVFCTGANAAPVVLANQGFESGLTGWTSTGSVAAAGETSVVTSGSDWIIAPYQTQMAYLDGSGAFASGLDNFFGLSAGTIDAAVAGDDIVTNGAGIQQSFTGHAGETVTQFWDFVARDSAIYSNDSAFVVVNGQVTVLASIQDGGIAVGSYGNSDWQSFSYTLPADGAYTLGFGVVNTGDFVARGALFLDNQAAGFVPDAQSASTVPEPETVTLLLAGLGLLGFMTKRKNSFDM
ncbi:MAG: PEP-CTERM sorting domain-containing protein [Nitrosospira sp.]|nr:PEP-CTERM sorting domain-containing protein [Nitrosospira sp.]